jgi:hypothetical protein
MNQPDTFGYIEALQLLILAIGVTKIIEGLSGLLEHRRIAKPYWPHTLAAVTIAVLQLQYAWASFILYTVPRWSFADFLLQCATPLIYLFVSDLLFPDERPSRQHFVAVYESRVRLTAILVMVAQVANVGLDHRYHPAERNLVLQDAIRLGVCVLLAGLLLSFRRHRRLHEVILLALFGALIFFCLFLTPGFEVGTE